MFQKYSLKQDRIRKMPGQRAGTAAFRSPGRETSSSSSQLKAAVSHNKIPNLKDISCSPRTGLKS